MSEIVNVLQALVADGTEVTIIAAARDLRVVAFKRLSDERLIWAIRRVNVTEGDLALSVAFTEIYLQMRNGISDAPNSRDLKYAE